MLVGVKTQEDLWGKEGIITQLNKALLERILDAEMVFHLENGNGHGRKTVHGKFDQIELITSRYRNSTFEPQIITKRSTTRDIQATL